MAVGYQFDMRASEGNVSIDEVQLVCCKCHPTSPGPYKRVWFSAPSPWGLEGNQSLVNWVVFCMLKPHLTNETVGGIWKFYKTDKSGTRGCHSTRFWNDFGGVMGVHKYLLIRWKRSSYLMYHFCIIVTHVTLHNKLSSSFHSWLILPEMGRSRSCY